MTRVRALIVSALIVSAIALTSGQTSDRTFLAIVRSDGLVPIAISDGEDWWNSWPWPTDEEMKTLEIPASIETIPPEWLPPNTKLPVDWMFQRASGPPIKIRVTPPLKPLLNSLANTVSVPSTYTAQIEDGKRAGERGEIGVAIAGPGTLGRFEKASSAEYRRLLGRLTPRLRALEEDALKEWREEPGAGQETIVLTPGRTRKGEQPYELLKVVRPFKGQTSYYVTGEKWFAQKVPPGQAECSVNVSTAGVVVTRPDGTIVDQRLEAGAYGGYCGDPASRLALLATVEWHDRVLWVVCFSLEDGYNYALFDPNTNGQVPLKGAWALRPYN
jgi:hypothetical protein